MSSLRSLERDVHEFLSHLAHVSKVEVEASVTTQGRKRIRAVTFLSENSPENRTRIYNAEEFLMDRHETVEFDFSCTTLKERHGQRTVGTPEVARVS